MDPLKKLVLTFTAVLFAGWILINVERISEDQDALIRMILSSVFAILILMRRGFAERIKRDEYGELISSYSTTQRRSDKVVSYSAVLGAVLMIMGIVFGVHQVEWIGFLMVLFACLRWSLPRIYLGDILLSLLMIYWLHPLPAQIFGPFQMAMQRMSVEGAEWFLHCLNVRVWSDNMIIYTGHRLFGVPEACSGMRTAVTVLLSGLGVGILLRFRLRSLVLLLIAGLIQVLVMNIARISVMVVVAPKMPDEWAETFLHDSTGLFLLAAIFLVNLEASVCAGYVSRRRRQADEAAARGDNDPSKLDIQTLGRHRLFNSKLFLVGMPVVIVLSLGVAGLIYKSRGYHRAMMVHSVIEQLVITNPEYAEKASAAAVELAPDDITLQNQKVKVLLVREKFDEALAELKGLPEGKREVLHTMLEAWVLMGMEKPDEAIALIDDLPGNVRHLPGVAMVRAEFAATRDDTKGVVENIVHASNSAWMIRRVRALFPYLASRHQWETIIACDVRAVPYEKLNDVIVLLHAYMKADKIWSMSSILEYGLEKWPDEPTFVNYMASLAMMEPGSRWEDLFAAHLKANLFKYNTDELSVYIENSFRMNRPDLAWMLYNRLKVLDSKDPTLHLCVAQFGHQWFTFRKHYVGLLSIGKYETTDLRKFYFKRREWPKVPLFEEMTSGEGSAMAAEYLKKCLSELKKRKKEKRLTLRMRAIYPAVLEKAGQSDKAEDELWDYRAAASKNRELVQVLGAINAELKMRRSLEAWKLLKPAMEKWPHEYRLMDSLGTLAVDNPGSGFEKLFISNLKKNLDNLTVDELSVCIEKSFRMNRPTLAWLAYNKLQAIDPDDPSLYLMPILFSAEWFMFRNTEAGIYSESKSEIVYLKTLYEKSMNWPAAPMAEHLAVEESETAYHGYLEKCLSELKRREAAGQLSVRMQMMYPTTLGLMGRFKEAHARLDKIAEKYPSQIKEVLFRHALFYHREGDWDRTYESLREYSQFSDLPRLKLELIRIDCLMRLKLGAYALYAADRTLETFRGSPEAHQARAAVWATFNSPEEALFEIQNVDNHIKLPLTVRLLMATERYEEAKYVGSIYGTDVAFTHQNRQAVLLPHAELAVTPTWDLPLKAEEMTREGEAFAKASQTSFSPFVRGLQRKKAQWLVMHGKGASSDPAGWLSIGRDKLEKGLALTELAMLLAQQKRYTESAAVVDQALKLLPDSIPLRRASVSLSKGDMDVVNAARAACPNDSEIWLAYLVARYRRDGVGDWLVQEINEAVTENSFSSGTMVRAGDFLRRNDVLDLAMTCSKHAVRKCRGLLPAYVLGLRCSLAVNDVKWAQMCANQAAQNALNSWPFIRMIGEIELTQTDISLDQEGVFQKLAEKFPDDSRWAVQLSNIYLLKGEPKNALDSIESVIANQPENINLRILLLAGEAARRSGDIAKSITILERAYAMHPSNRVALNNLVYSLAFDRKTIPRAISLLPKLFELWGESFVAFETAAVVYRNADDREKSEEYIRKAMNSVRNIDPVWLKRNTTVVDIDTYLGDYDYNLDKDISEVRQELREMSRKSIYSGGSGLRKKVMESVRN